MKSRLKKLISLVLSVLIIAICFSSCGGLKKDSWQVKMPDISGMDYDEALKTLKENNLIGIITDKVSSSDIKRNCVVSQKPESGETVNRGSVAEIVLSAGGDVIFIPDFSYYKKDTAIELLKTFGINTKVVEADSKDANPYVAPGAVSWSVPDPGKAVSIGGTVELLVKADSAAPAQGQMVEVPSLIGRDYYEMVRVLADRNIFLSIESADYGEASDKNLITGQSKVSGQKVPEGSVVYVSVCLGAMSENVPDVTCMTQKEAEETLSRSGLVAEVSYSESKTVAKGLVIKQTKAAGDAVSDGEKVGIVVSEGCSVTVPDVVGKDEKTAIGMIAGSLLQIRVVYTDDGMAEAGTVTEQSIAPGEKADIGEPVTVYIKEAKRGLKLDGLKENIFRKFN